MWLGGLKNPRSRLCCSSPAGCPWARYRNFLVPSSPSETGVDTDSHTPGLLQTEQTGTKQVELGRQEWISNYVAFHAHHQHPGRKPESSSSSLQGHSWGKPRFICLILQHLGVNHSDVCMLCKCPPKGSIASPWGLAGTLWILMGTA